MHFWRTLCALNQIELHMKNAWHDLLFDIWHTQSGYKKISTHSQTADCIKFAMIKWGEAKCRRAQSHFRFSLAFWGRWWTDRPYAEVHFRTNNTKLDEWTLRLSGSLHSAKNNKKQKGKALLNSLLLAPIETSPRCRLCILSDFNGLSYI